MPLPLVLFGAFDRHNFGDLLLAHVAAALLAGRQPVFAGLAERDLRPVGGHRVQALARLLPGWAANPVHLVHVGGEILTCDAWQAAAMLLPPGEAPSTIAYLSRRPRLRREWARRRLGVAAHAPYVASRSKYAGLATAIHAGVGGVDLDRVAPALRREVLADLASAAAVGVRDRRTQLLLAQAGIATRLMPDPAVMVAALFGDRILRGAGRGDVASIRRAWPAGYVAVQFSAEFGDDATLAQVAGQLEEVCAAEHLGVALFRAGAAPWHDDLGILQRAAGRMHGASVRVFESLALWDICALLAHSRGFCGSSLHGRIVALAFGVPRVSLRRPAAPAGKVAAFAACWDDRMPYEVDPPTLAAALRRALTAPPQPLRDLAEGLADRYRAEFSALCAMLR